MWLAHPGIPSTCGYTSSENSGTSGSAIPECAVPNETRNRISDSDFFKTRTGIPVPINYSKKFEVFFFFF